MRLPRIVTLIAFLFGAGAFLAALSGGAPGAPRIVEPLSLDAKLARVLHHASFTGRVGSSLEKRLGRPIDPELARLGNLLFFDRILGLHGDNACAGCHSPSNGFGDTQSMAIGIQSNEVVGPHRTGPRNQRRTPMVLNNAFSRSSCGTAASAVPREIRSTTRRASRSRFRR